MLGEELLAGGRNQGPLEQRPAGKRGAAHWVGRTGARPLQKGRGGVAARAQRWPQGGMHHIQQSKGSREGEPPLGRTKHGGADGDAGAAVSAAAEKQSILAAAKVSALLATGVLDTRSRPHTAEDDEEAGMELTAGFRCLLLRDGGGV